MLKRSTTKANNMRKVPNGINKLTIIAIVGFLLIAYITASEYYYHKNVCLEHHFDPYLQVSSKILSRSSIDKAGNVFRILCLGGSTTLDDRNPARRRWPALLKNYLQKKYPQIKVEVINAGMHWYTTKHSLINYVTYYKDWNPDLVIIMHGINDLYRTFSPEDFAIGEYNDRWTHFYGAEINGAKKPMTLEIYFRYRFLRAIDKFFRIMSHIGISTKSTLNGLPIKEVNYPPEKYVSIEMFKRHLALLARYARLDKAIVILMTEPYLYKTTMTKEERQAVWFDKSFCLTRISDYKRSYYEYPSLESLASAMALFNKTTKEIANTEGAILIDADNYIPKNLVNFRDDVHYKEAGSRLLAKLVAKNIIDRNLISAKVKDIN